MKMTVKERISYTDKKKMPWQIVEYFFLLQVLRFQEAKAETENR